MKAEINLVIETDEFDFREIEDGFYKIQVRHTIKGGPGFTRNIDLAICAIEIKKVLDIKADIETVHRCDGRDSKEYVDALARVLAFAKEQSK